MGNARLPGVILKEWEGSDGSHDDMIGADIAVFWAADKMEFLQKGQCTIGLVQIVKRDVDYWSESMAPITLGWDHDWRIDGGVPYPHPEMTTKPTSTNPFSTGMLSLTDSPGQAYKLDFAGLDVARVANLRSVRWDFETCVVALPTGEEASIAEEAGLWGEAFWLEKMAVYGCLNWSVHARAAGPNRTWPRGPEDFVVTRSLRNQTTDDETIDLKYTGAGDGPSDVFIELIDEHYTGDWSAL
jgi:hypothetical protein